MTFISHKFRISYETRGRAVNVTSLASWQDYVIVNGAKNYRVRIPANVPAKDFWSVVLYDPQTRSELQTVPVKNQPIIRWMRGERSTN
jgi:hypothetical protein